MFCGVKKEIGNDLVLHLSIPLKFGISGDRPMGWLQLT